MFSITDPFADLKARQREMWSSFAPVATFSTPIAAHLVEFTQIKPGEKVRRLVGGRGLRHETFRADPGDSGSGGCGEI
jgi:hypothetical protein